MTYTRAHKKLFFKVLLFLMVTLSHAIANAQEQEISNTRILFEQAIDYQQQNKIKEAIETLDQARDIAEKNENLKELLDCYLNYALLYLEIKDRERAHFYQTRARVLLKDVAYPHGEAVVKYIDAKFLFEDENYFQAIKTLEESKISSNERALQNRVLMLEAEIALIRDKPEEAQTNLNALLVDADGNERSYLATKANMTLAKLDLENNDFDDAIKHATAALEIAERNNFSSQVFTANEFLTTVYEQKGAYKQSLRHQRNLMAIKDSLFNIDRIKAEDQTSDAITRKHMAEEIDRLEIEKEELSQSANRSEITAILTSAFLTIISLLAVSLYRNNQIKLKTNDLLQNKNTELETARDSAISAMKAKSNFLSTVTHELRTPLYAVTGLTHLLLEENPSEHQKDHLKSLKFSGDYLLNFINDILQINKIDADKVEILSTEFNLKTVLADVIDSLQQKAKENETALLLKYDSSIPKVLLGDPMKLSQIFMNLIGNALKFTKNGQVEVITKMVSKVDDDIKLYFEVKDNGIGISEEQQKNIFDSFEQGSIQINREYGGTGLGLTIVKSLLGLFNSEIGLRSQLDKGSSFFFELDVQSGENTVVTEIPFELEPEKLNLEGLHLLLVEDNKINQVITKKMLNKRDMTCDIANNGHEAVDLAKANTYDAILMDIHMPGISGEEATRQIRKFDKNIPIIALTAISLDDSVESFFESGCNDIVTKPFKPEVFYQKIAENIAKAKVKSEA